MYCRNRTPRSGPPHTKSSGLGFQPPPPSAGTQEKSRLDAVASGFVKGFPGGDVGLELLEKLGIQGFIVTVQAQGVGFLGLFIDGLGFSVCFRIFM